MRRLSRYLLVLGLALFAAPAHADPWIECGCDAGDLPFLAQDTTTMPNLTEIQGSLDYDGGDGADMYRIYISDPAAFSASTVGTPGTLADTYLFLLNEDGTPVYGSADADDGLGGFDLRSDLPAGHIGSPVTPGYYYLGITPEWIEPLDADDEYLFCGCPGVMAPTSSLPISYYFPNQFDFPGFSLDSAGTGTYTIVLTGVEAASTPEPGTLALFSLGLLGVGGSAWHRRKPGSRPSLDSTPGSSGADFQGCPPAEIAE